MARYAFFDVDGTVINMKSMFSFLQFLWMQPELYGETLGNKKYRAYTDEVQQLLKGSGKREVVNLDYYKQYTDLPVALVDDISHRWWESVKNSKQLLNHRVCQQIRQHQRKGIEVVFVSGSMKACLQHLQRHLNVKQALCTNQQRHNDKYTGNIVGDIMIGKGKAEALNQFMLANTGDFNSSFAYGDHHSDIPMMSLVEHAIAVNPNAELKQFATQKQWHIIMN